MASIKLTAPRTGGGGSGGGFGNRILGGIEHYAEKPMFIPPIKTPSVPAPKAPSGGAGPAVKMPKFPALGGAAQPSSMGGGGGFGGSKAAHMSKQVSPRVTVARRELVPASRPIGMTSQDEGSGGLT